MQASRAALIVLDGFGLGKESPFNAIENAEMPFYRELRARFPFGQLITHGEVVGLPDGIMGNSEVGHMTMGAGRTIFQDLTRINRSIRDKSFFQNPVLNQVIKASKRGRLHLMGLISDGGVHSHEDHLFALLEMAHLLSIKEVYIHVFTDGRDTPPNSGIRYLENLEKNQYFQSTSQTKVRIATVMGRYFAMDRDQRFERTEKAYRALTGQIGCTAVSPSKVFEATYSAKVTDEFIEPVWIEQNGSIQDDDSVFFFNYRSDRARQISRAFTETDFQGFDRGKRPVLAQFASMTIYEKSQNFRAAFDPQNQNNIMGSWLEDRGLKQFRIAETEKFAHVTFFFNGGREKPYEGEDRVLVPSPKEVATYDLKPEMSAHEVAAEASRRIEEQKYDFVLMNFANADMVGHTGNYHAAVLAMTALDQCLAKVVSSAMNSNMHVVITADHGNAEEMIDKDGHIHTQHTLNPVPIAWIEPNGFKGPKRHLKRLKDGSLADVMPTLCELMRLPVPEECTGRSLL